jgi:DNA-binding response OmpR family regulator
MERRSEAEAARTLSGARVLVVEDEAIIGFELQASLTDAGAQVIGPSLTLTEAFALASHENLSAAVLDIRLGRETIGPVARQLAARGIPFLFYTGQVETDPIRAEWPHCKIISKPAPLRSLVGAVSALLHG